MRTLKEIADDYGWSFSQHGMRAATTYIFTKGLLEVAFSRAGYGCLKVTWAGWDTHWRQKGYGQSREEYAESLLCTVNEVDAKRLVAARLLGAVSKARTELSDAEDELTRFDTKCTEVR